MQNQSNPSANNAFTLMPMGAQQFYQMAQQHAMVNGSFAPVVPSYLPLSDSDAYSSMMAFGAYNMPQNMMPAHSALEPSMYAPEMSLWGAGGFGYAPHPASATAAADASAAQWMDMRAPSPPAASAPLSPIPASPLPAAPSTRASGPGPAESGGDAEHISDAPFADEHKWRKYGQKQVKRSPYPRNYYKCTISGCPAKKHLEKFWDNATNRERCRTVYIGEHVHPVAASPQVFAMTQLDFQNNVLAQSAKIRSLHGTYGLTSDVDQQRLVVECGSQVDENEDGYLWRKYGQKAVKGSSTPRQYYRCRSINCPVKKTVEASPKGNTVVTYDGCHNHEAGFHSPHSSAVVSAESTSPASPESYPSRAPSPSAMTAASYLVRFAPVHSGQQVLSSADSAADVLAAATSMGVSSQPHESHATMPQSNYEAGSNFISAPSYPVADSPSSSFSTTDDDESYLSEPSPKRSLKDEDVSLDEQYHQFAPDAPEPWYYPSAWDAAPGLVPGLVPQ